MRRHLPHAAAFLAGALCCFGLQVFYRKGQAEAPEEQRGLALNLVEGEAYRVRRVVDGDTLVLANGLHVRFAGINTPERGRYVREPAPLAERARERAVELLEGRRVRLAFARDPLDAHGRVVAHVRVAGVGGGEGGDVDVEAMLVREGLARAMGLGLPPEDYARLKGLEDQARGRRAGIWGLETPPGTRETAGFAYCASGGSEVFHRADCPAARRIPAAGFQGYRTLEEAVAGGRRICSQCGKALGREALAGRPESAVEKTP